MRRLGGKSVIIAEIIKLAGRKHNQVLFLVHRKELVEQIRKTLILAEVDFNYVELYMMQTATRHIDKIKSPTIIIVDECHSILSNSYKRILAAFPKAIVCGFTATPIRMNEGGLGEVFEQLVIGVSTQWLIDNRFLAPFKAYSVPLADTSGLHVKRGEFDQQEVENLMSQGAIFGDTVANWKRLANGKKTIVYCASVKTSKATTQAFKEAGILAEHLDGTTPATTRDNIVQAFRDGKITVLCNVELFGIGFDVPDCECVVLLRPTKSLTLHIQQSMRSMRYKENKTALILDHVGNLYRHGLPTDVHEWSLETKKRKKNEVHIKECPGCYAVLPRNTRVCPHCGYDFEAHDTEMAERREQLRVEAQLREFERMPYSRYEQCRDFDELMLFAKAKKYHIFWAIHKAIEMEYDIPPKFRWIARSIMRKMR